MQVSQTNNLPTPYILCTASSSMNTTRWNIPSECCSTNVGGEDWSTPRNPDTTLRKTIRSPSHLSKEHPKKGTRVYWFSPKAEISTAKVGTPASAQ